MRRNIFRITAIMATALLAFAGVGCVEPLEPVERDPNARDLIIRLSVPGQGIPVTKAGTGPVNGISPESQVYTVQVWAFNHYAADSDAGDSEKAVAYSTVDLGTTGWANTVQRPSGYYDEWTNTTTYEVPMTFPGYVLDRDAEDMKFDFYVLANASSIGCTAGQDATRGTLKSLSFGGDNFGTATPKTGATPTAILGTTGLPISGFFNKTKNAQGQSPYVGPAGGVDLSFLKTQPSITAAEMHQLVPVVQLKRAVSKIRFAFARPTGMADIQITKIVIDEMLIPASTFVFPREDGTEFELPNGSGYTTGAATIGSDDSPLFVVPKNYTGSDIIAAVSDPEALKSDSEKKLTTNQAKTPSQMDAQEYDTFLSAHSTSQIAYLRESGKPITGKIYYKIGATSSEAPFTMEGLTNTNFHRNHYWTVYAYFQGGDLRIKPVLVQDWVYDATKQYFEYKQNGEAHIVFSDKAQSLFGYGYTTATVNNWYSEGKPTEWYFRRQDWNSVGHEHDVAQPGTAAPYAWNDWVHSQMVVAPGLNAANVPTYSNRIELVTSQFTVPLRLMLTNTTDFSIVIYHDGSNEYEVISDTYAEIPYEVTHSGGRTFFYVVPKDTATPGVTTSVYLVTGTDSNAAKLPFNSNAFPGSEDYTEVYFYCVNPTTFEDYYTTQPANVKAYDKNGEVTL